MELEPVRALLTPLSLVALALVGCSANVSTTGEAADAEAASSTAAIVVVARTSGPGEASRGDAVARFVRLGRAQAVDADYALRAVGAAVELPVNGACVSVSGLAPTTGFAQSVQLLDVGGVALVSNGARTPLTARQVPDVVDVVSGVVYARATDGESLPAGASYQVHVTGSSDQDVPQLRVAADAPAELDLRIAGQDARLGAVALSASEQVELAWDPGNEGDLVYADIAASFAGLPTIRCAFPDTGHATLGAPAFAPGDDGTITVHRLHRERFRARGLDAGEVRFDFARVVGFSRR
jgi:hypothetical protein